MRKAKTEIGKRSKEMKAITPPDQNPIYHIGKYTENRKDKTETTRWLDI